MKFKWMSVLAIALMIGFVGCGGESAEEAPAEVEEAVEEAAEAVDEAVEEVAEEVHEHGEAAHDHGEEAHEHAGGAIKGLTSKLQEAVDVASAIANQEVEAGCASCMYEMEGVKGCVLAVKIGDTPHLVKGLDFDTHGSGLCDSTMQAKIEGDLMEDGTLTAKEFSLIQ